MNGVVFTIAVMLTSGIVGGFVYIGNPYSWVSGTKMPRSFIERLAISVLAAFIPITVALVILGLRLS